MAACVPGLLPAALRHCRNTCLLLLALATGGCATLQPYPESPRVSLVSIKPEEIQMLEQRFVLELRIQNPNSVAIPVEGMSYALEINQREFAYGVSRQAVTIPPYGEALVQVEVASNLLNVMRQLQQPDDAPGGGLDYRLHGRIGLADRLPGLPFDYSGRLAYWDPDAPAAAGSD